MQFSQPSQALAAAQDGDTIKIAPGQYFDCGYVLKNGVTVEGSGPNTVITDKTCGGKALLIVNGDNVTIRDLTLQRARVPDENGAGIRAQGGNLTVENVRFINNQDGILTNPNPRATIKIIGSEFVDNGTCEQECAHGIYINTVGLLRVERTRFFATHHGHHIKSLALRTEIINCDIEDGPEGDSSYLIDIPRGGSLIVQDSKLQKGPNAENHGTAIMIGEGGVGQPTDELIIKNNHFTNDLPMTTTFVRNITATRAQLTGNVLKGKVRPLDGDGSVR